MVYTYRRYGCAACFLRYKYIKTKRKLHKERATTPVVMNGPYVVNKINNSKEQTNNNVHIGKRRMLRPGMRKNTDNNSADGRSLPFEGSDGCRSLISQENDDFHNSFDSVDNHPKAVNYYNYFVGKGQKHWSTQAEEALAVTYEEVNASNILQEYRKESLVAARHLLNISDCRINQALRSGDFCNRNIPHPLPQIVLLAYSQSKTCFEYATSMVIYYTSKSI